MPFNDEIRIQTMSALVTVGQKYKLLLVILIGLFVGMVDMVLFKPTGFRVAEVLVILMVFLESKVSFVKIRKNVVALAIATLAILFIIEPSNLVWFVKLFALSSICYVALNNSLPLSVRFMLGIAFGYTVYSAGLIILGENFIAKYSAVHCAIFLLPMMVAKNTIKRIFALIALGVAIYVAIASNSRGQILLLLGVISMILAAKCRIAHVARVPVLLLVIFLGMQLSSLPVKLYNLEQVMQEGNVWEANAGDLERSLLGAYALLSIAEAPRGQSREEVELSAVGSVATDVDVMLQTTSAHNVVEDSMLFGGVPGLLLLFVIYSFLFMHTTIFHGLHSNRVEYFRIVVPGVMIISFILATSPIAGIERIQIILVASLLAIYVRRSNTMFIRHTQTMKKKNI